MCGIFAVVRRKSSNLKSLHNVVEQGLTLVQHRGPDGAGIWKNPNETVGFGHVRLAIVSVSDGAQPMTLEDGTTIVFNGEIYNYIELREQLGLSLFKSTSDTEVILHAFKRWGENCVDHLRGMFAFLIWDPSSQKVFYARDRFGVKPLYCYEDANGDYFFASEMKAFLPFMQTRCIDDDALSEYFSFQFCLGNKTLLRGVRQIEPAHSGWISSRGFTGEKRYWDPQYQPDFDSPDKYFIEELKFVTEESVKFHMRADVEIGAYVSGGIDSSLLAILGSKYTTSDKKFKIFNGKFEESRAFDESAFAQAVADENDMELYVNSITEEEFVDSVQDVIYHLDTPIAGPGAFPQYMVSKHASEYVKVVLGGQGGDEIFGGYARYLIAYFEECIKAGIDGTLNNANFVVTYESIIPNLQTLKAYKPLIKEFWADGLFEERDARYFRLINRANTIAPLLSPDVIKRDRVFDVFRDIFWSKNVGKESYFDLMTHFDFKTLLPALLHVEDRMSMAHGLESRVPFLDHPLIELAATAPANVKFLNGELKRWVRESFQNQLPSSIRNRKDKMGFPVPLNTWLKNGGMARDFIGDTFSTKKAKARPYLSENFSFESLMSGEGTYGRNLWGLLSLELWHQSFID